MQTDVTRNPRHSLLAKTTSSKLSQKNWRVQILLMLMKFIFPILWMLSVELPMYETTMRFKGRHAGGKDDVQSKM